MDAPHTINLLPLFADLAERLGAEAIAVHEHGELARVRARLPSGVEITTSRVCRWAPEEGLTWVYLTDSAASVDPAYLRLAQVWALLSASLASAELEWPCYGEGE